MDATFIKALYQAFDNAKDFFTDADLLPIGAIDKYRGQPLNPEQFETFDMPAIFYELRCEWTKNGKLYTGIITATFHIMQDATWETSNISTNRDEGLKQTEQINAIRYVLDDLRSPTTGKLTRLSDIPVDTGVTTYDQLVYTCIYTPQQIQVGKFEETVTPELTVQGELKERI